MPVIKKVFSLAPYREYLEGTESSIDIPKDHPHGDTPPQNAGSGQKPAGVQSHRQKVTQGFRTVVGNQPLVTWHWT
ncbi:hypothetical protein ASZ78_016470 [Callipepla squamata]|uniref:Uncharacterized protein n=1 Tax=Callipepla squamata TaxID=9009 RepID=A0A226MKD6_CALSU|nr:hypothetical protein ASZ78_016470 [Callipepla squamata]